MQSTVSRRIEERRRNLCVYDRRFENSKRKEEWLVTSGMNFNSFLRILSETFAVPDHETFLLVTTARTVLDAERFVRLEDGATLYMLQREDQVLEVPAEELIFFTPHHDTVVESGTFKYYDSEGKKSLPYALADLVDNALSATVNNTGVRKIEIRMLFDESYGKPAVIVWDNGCGMTSKQLNNWAVYKLSKFKRENGRCAGDQGSYAHPGHVSRSLNSDISYFGVGGKQAAFYIGKSTRVISKSSGSPDVHELVLSKALFEKKEKNKEDTYSTTIYNRKRGVSTHYKAEDRFLHDLIAEECKNESFTAVVITDVLQDHITFLKEDFEVWTRQLAHIYHYYLHGPNGNVQGAVPKSNITDSQQTSKIDIQVTIKTKNAKSPHVVNLRDIETDMQSLYIKAAFSTFEFKACTNPEAGVVEGIIRYHPFLYDRETYPEDPDSPKKFAEDDEDDYNPDSQAKKQKKPGFECYWNGRLIPYTTIQEFDWCSQPPKGSKVPAECYNRFSGVLFTDDTFKVTENKLTFIDLEQKLKNKDTIFTLVMKGQKQRTNLQRDFVQWLQKCHEEYDKQVKFLDFQGTITREDIQTKRNQHPWATFSSMEWGGRLYKTGDYVKSIKTVPIYNGKVNCFLLFGTHDGDVYAPGGQVEICLEPKGLYEKTKIIHVAKLDRNATDEEIKNGIKTDSAKLPDKLQVQWPNKNPLSDNTFWPAGTVLGPIKVQILNKKGETMSRLPSVGHGVGKKMSVVLRLVHHVPDGDQEMFFLEAQHSASWDFWFKEIENIVELGKYTLHLLTIQTETKAIEFGERRLPHFKFKFTIKEDVADQFDVAKMDSTVRIGVPFDISLQIKDKHGHATEPPPGLKPTFQCRGLDVTYEQVKCGGDILIIKNVRATGKLKNHVEPNPFDLMVTLDGLREHSKTLKISILPGYAHSIHVFPKEEPIEVENGNAVKFTVMIQDEAGNITATPKMTNARCLVAGHPPAHINCMGGVGEHVTRPINLALTNGKSQILQVRFSAPNRSAINEVTRKLLVLPSKRVNRMTVYKKDVHLELKNKERIDWMAGSVLENLYFMLYDEGDRKVPITAEVASKVKVNWTGEMNLEELMEGKLPNVTVPTKVQDHHFYQVSYQDQSVSVSFTIVPIPDVPAGLKAILPKCTGRLGEILPEHIVLVLVDRYENVTKTMTLSSVNEITAEAEGLDKRTLTFNFEESSASVRVAGVCFSSGTPGFREMTFTFRNFTGHVRVEVTAGVPAKLELVSEHTQLMHVLNGHGIPTPFVVQLCDQWGNPSPDKRVVVKISASSELKVKTNVSSRPVNAEGQASFTVTDVSGPKGSYELSFRGNFLKKPIPGPSVNLTVLPDPNKPVSLDVQYDTTATFVAGEFFPVFSVTVMSDEGSPIINQQVVSMLYWKGAQSTEAPHNTLQLDPSHSYGAKMLLFTKDYPLQPFEFQCCEPKENEKKDTFYFREKTIPERVGKYTIQFCLRETKDKITLRSNQILVNVVANKPMKLAPENLPQTQVVSYSDDIAKRLLVENMTLVIMDKFGNPAGQGLNGNVDICIKNVNSKCIEQLPLLEDKTKCNIMLENGKAHVSTLAIMKKSPGKHGVTYMVLFKPVLSSRFSGNLDAYEFHFGFSNDEENQKEFVALSRQRDSVKEAIVRINEEQKNHEGIIRELRGLVQITCEKELALRNELKNKWNVDIPENASIETVNKILSAKLHEAERISSTTRRICRIPNHEGPNILGKVCHLAQVIDNADAWVISWQIRGDMDCVITTTTTAARQVYDLTHGKQQVLPIDTINANCRRPLPSLPHIQNGRALFKPMGNPEYAVNVLIHPKNQAECEILFRTLLGKTILIDDLDSANLYRQSVVKNNSQCPTILTRKGERVSANGKFGGAQNRAPSPDQLHMFAAPLPADYNILKLIIDRLHLYLGALDKKLKTQLELQKVYDEHGPVIQRNRQSLGGYEHQLQEIETKLATPLRSMKRASYSCGETSGVTDKRAKLG